MSNQPSRQDSFSLFGLETKPLKLLILENQLGSEAYLSILYRLFLKLMIYRPDAVEELKIMIDRLLRARLNIPFKLEKEIMFEEKPDHIISLLNEIIMDWYKNQLAKMNVPNKAYLETLVSEHSKSILIDALETILIMYDYL